MTLSFTYSAFAKLSYMYGLFLLVTRPPIGTQDSWSIHMQVGFIVYVLLPAQIWNVPGKRTVGNTLSPKSCSYSLGLNCRAGNLFWRQHLASRLHFHGSRLDHQWTFPYCKRFLQKREWLELIFASWMLFRLHDWNKAMLTQIWFCIPWMCNTTLLCKVSYSIMCSIFMYFMNVKFHYDSSTLLLLSSYCNQKGGRIKGITGKEIISFAI